MRRLALRIEYDGSRFNGWQVQPEGRTVQGAVEEALFRTTGERRRVTGASRTDSGVHAEGQVAHLDTASELPIDRFVPALNYWLPDDVSVLECHTVAADFDARRHAVSKLYRYRILRSNVRHPLREGRTMRVWRPLDIAAMKACADALEGEHDFTSFASEHTDVEGRVRRLTRSELVEADDELHYFVEANGFLYNMVRIIVGTLLEAGLGKIDPGEIGTILAKRDRALTGPTAPARALTLLRVDYPPGTFPDAPPPGPMV